MWTVFLILGAMSLRVPDTGTWERLNWQPQFTESSEIHLRQPTVAFFTHSSRHFDPLGETQAAVIRVAATMKDATLPILYLHDRHNNKNPAWMYLYDDWHPTAYVASDVGHFDLNFQDVRHVISLGGYFGQCQRSTVEDAIHCWRRDAPHCDFRVTMITDGIFCVSEYVRGSDPYYWTVRNQLYGRLRKRHPNAAISLEGVLHSIRDLDQAIDYLCRQLPSLPSDVHVVLDFMGHTETLQLAKEEAAPTLTIAWRRSERFLQFNAVMARRASMTDRGTDRQSGTRAR